jgi:hypothetical protein
MRMRNGVVSLICLILFSALSVHAEVLRQTFEFSPDELVFRRQNDYDQIYLREGNVTDQVGRPQVPFRTFHLALPPGAAIQTVEIISSTGNHLPGQFTLFPAQPPQILSTRREIVFVGPDTAVYAAGAAYPGTLAEPAGVGGYAGYQLAGVDVYPLQYEPQAGRIIFYTRIDVAITYVPGANPPLGHSPRDPAIENADMRVLRQVVTNPGQAAVSMTQPVLAKTALDPGEYEYLVITSSYFSPALAPLIEWKTAKGVPAKMVTTTWIYTNYSGADPQEQIRNFIRDAYQQWGVRWVLLGGDTWVVPHRTAWAMDVAYGGSFDENEIPTDLYYSDLDGAWDANMNGIYGEVDDDIDLYPEVFVGRASCDEYSEMAAWVNKLIAYETNPPTDYQLAMSFYADVLWDDPFTDGGAAKNEIDNLYVPDRFDPIDKLYQTLGNESIASVIASINAGRNMINHNGHCWIDYMSVCTGGLTGVDMDNLYNGPRFSGFMFSIGCWPGAFDYDCVAEHFITSPNGGGIAFVGNSRYGWGSPGNSEFGYSDRYDQQFFKALLVDSLTNIGAALAKAKIVLTPHARQENVYRWCMYETNLLGDPEMPVWTDTPSPLIVNFPELVPSAGGDYTLTVTSSDTTSPVGNALICLWKENDLYVRALTGADGRADVTVSPDADGQIELTVTAFNHLPYRDQITVGTGGTTVEYDSHSYDDVAGGNGDGVLNPGEDAVLWLTVENHGPGAANALTGYLAAHSDPYVTLVSGALDFGDVPAGATATSLSPCALSVHPDCPDGHVALFNWTLTDAGAQVFTGVLSVHVKSASVSYYRYRIDDASGNDNGRPDPGETCGLRVWVNNSGSVTAEGVAVTMWAADPLITIIGSPVGYGDLPGDQYAYGDFSVIVDPLCPSPYFIDVELRAQASDGTIFNDTFVLAIGPNGFSDDLETGAFGWTHGGTNDRWALTDHRTHSGSAAWYCGTPGVWTYLDNMNCFLDIPEVVLGPDSRLTFWDWFEVPNYGVDGIHVRITDLDASQTKTLDFIGTGGALDSAYRTGNEWVRESYDLSAYPAGTRAKVRINFSSDNDHDIEEGFYIDDLRIESVPDYDVVFDPTHHLLRGGEGDTLDRRVYVTNTGFWADSYSLNVTGGGWSASLWNEAGTAEISTIGPVAPGGTAVALLRIVVPSAAAGAADTSIVTAVSAGDPARITYTTTIAVSEGGAGSSPWLDMVPDPWLSTEMWPLSDGVSVRGDFEIVPSLPYIADLRYGASLLSQRIDLAGQSNLRVAFWYKPSRASSSQSWYGPCDLTVEYYASSGIWRQLAVLHGDYEDEEYFAEAEYSLPTAAYHADFRLRLRTNNNDVGHWYLDDVYIGPRREFHFMNTCSPPPGYGASSEEAVQYLYVENLGLLSDSYDLAAVSSNWPVSFWDESGPITQTGMVAPGATETIMVKVAIPEGTLAQAADTAFITIASTGNAAEWRYAKYRSVCVGAVAAFPWGDDFPTGTLQLEKWPIQSGGGVSAQGPAPSPPYTLRIGGHDTVFTQMLDLSATSEAMLDVYCRAGSGFMLPREEDSAFIEMRTELGTWTVLRSFAGGGRYINEFERYCDELPPTAFYRGMQLRIRGQSELNYWYLDNIQLVLPPDCQINPGSIQLTVEPGGTGSSGLTISNIGLGEFEYHLEIIPTSLLLANMLARQGMEYLLAKAAPAASLLPEYSFSCDLGGPDAYGYLWIDSDEPYGPAFAWEDISGYGQQLSPINSYLYDTLKLAFDFPYYGTTYTELLVSRFGALQFGPESGINQWSALPMPHSIAPNNVLFWCWGNHSTLGTVYAHANEERAIIQFTNFGAGPGIPSQSATAQVELAADGRISYRYLQFGSSFATKNCGVGLEDQTGANGFGIVFYVNPLQDDPEYLHNNLQIDFYPPPSWIDVEPASGTVSPGGAQPVGFEFTAGELPCGQYDAMLRVVSNDPDPSANPYYVTARMTVYDTAQCYCPLGDTDLNGHITPLDVVILVNYVYRQQGEPLYPPKCAYSSFDVIPDDQILPIDVIYLVNYVYRNSSPPDNPCVW